MPMYILNTGSNPGMGFVIKKWSGNMDPLRLSIDIGMDIPKTVGTINRKIRTFSKGDVPGILESVAETIKTESEKEYVTKILETLSPEEYIQWDLSFFGNIHPGVFADVCVCLDRWSEVFGVEYIQPWGLPYRVFPSDDY